MKTRTRANKLISALLTLAFAFGLYAVTPMIAHAAPLPPSTPTNLTATAGEGVVYLSWNDSTQYPEYYIVERRDDNSGWGQMAPVLAGNMTYADTDVEAGKTYYYRVNTVSYGVPSPYSNEASATVPTPPPPPSPAVAPSNLTATVVAGGISLKWKDNSSTELGFFIERKEGGGDWAQYEYVGANTTSYKDTNVQIGKTYSYKLSAIGPGDTSLGYTNEVTITMTSTSAVAPVSTPSVFMVTMKYNNGKPDWIQNVKEGDKADSGVEPTRGGHTFDGWYKDIGLENIYNFNTPVTASITLYAKWSVEEEAVEDDELTKGEETEIDDEKAILSDEEDDSASLGGGINILLIVIIAIAAAAAGVVVTFLIFRKKGKMST